MGTSLPMFLPFHTLLRRLVGVCVLVLTVFTVGQAWAQAAVETYSDPSVATPDAEGVLPEGVEWNKPLKAGTLTLPRSTKSKSSKKQAAPANLPAGDPKAPQIQKPTQPPLQSSDKTSSASVMLLQGMKSALQKAGQNPNVPESSSTAEEVQASGDIGTAALVPPQLKKDDGAAAVDSAIKYEPGHAPKNLAAIGAEESSSASSSGQDVKVTAAAVSSASGGLPSTDKSLAPSIDAGIPELDIPKVTDLAKPPVSLEKTLSKKTEAKSGGVFSSIFGSPVQETEDDKAAEALAMPPESAMVKPSSKTCEPKVTSWTKECADAGYPATYKGKITGETRTECPSGDIKDVWLSNTCEGAPEPPKDTMSRAANSDQPSKAAATPASLPTSTERVDANCGTSNGLPSATRPSLGLCSAGATSEVSGEGPWRWSCKGMNGGVTVSCAAPLAKASVKASDKASEAGSSAPSSVTEDGTCGSADGAGFDSAPVDNLCAKGIASRVNGGGPWTWACSGTNGGQAAACSAPRKVDGVCGSAASDGADKRPERNLCAAGYASALSGEGPWHWTCSGLYGGVAATCETSVKVNAVCGRASFIGHRDTPKDELCKVGEASSVEGEGPWTWSCAGLQGGADVACSASVMVNGACGISNGKSFNIAPDEGLCLQGVATRVTGVGPWNWNCSGLEGGETVSCTASLGAPDVDGAVRAVACGTAADTPAFQKPVQNLCAGGKPSEVTGEGTWAWSCSDDEGHNVSCTAVQAVEAACGTAANVPSSEAPAANLCSSGGAGKVASDKSKKHWSWECRGSGSSTVSCSAPQQKATLEEEAKCGSAHGRGTSTAPTADLCEAGKAVSVQGKGPWTWSCASKSGRKVKCEAPKTVDGVCGATNGSIQKSLPLTGLCAAGAPTEVDGNGPWLWSCIGVGGGASVSCSAASQAQAKVDGVCGAAANSVMTRAPEANLCDGGAPSSVNGEGPWTWTCSGFNGGIASTCTTAKVLPKAPPPPGPAVNGNCGPANGVAAVNEPVDGLCSSGTVTDVSGHGPWNWNCLGINGGMTVSCTAPLMPPAPIVGECGAANGVTTLTKPQSALCSAGIASAVSGSGPWTWSCSGTNGGGAVSCVAPLASGGVVKSKGASPKPLPSTVTPTTTVRVEDEAPAPAAAPVGLVTPRLPSGPLPPLETGTLPQLKPSKPLNNPPEASVLPQKEFPTYKPSFAETTALPAASEPLTEPPIRDAVSPPPSLKPPAIDAEGKVIPGSRLVLDADLSTLSFDRGTDLFDKDVAATLDKLAVVLKKHPDARITLNAYAGTNGEITPREARRISLARALAIRDYLTNKGIPSGRIDVRALGANVPSGDMDRVDVKVN